MANMLEANSLRALPRVRHAFFTREGGVSDGVYASLNGGPGSEDAPDKVAENRARMAAVLGVAPDRLLTAYQIHSPDVVVIERPWRPHERPRADAIVTASPGLAIGVTTADCAPVLFAERQIKRRQLVAEVTRAAPVELDAHNLAAALGGRPLRFAVEATGSAAAVSGYSPGARAMTS